MAVSLSFRAPVFRAAAVAAALALVPGVLGAPPRALAADSVPAPPDVDVASYVVADYDTGQILAERAPHRALYPASTLKVLTADTLIPRLAADTRVTPKASDFAAEPDGSVVGMTAGVTYTVADLWRATFIDSANDAVAELAHLAGGPDATVALMREQARALGADDTVVADADGYDVDGQVTSAYDLALLARAGLRIPAFRSYCALRQATFPGPGGKDIALKSHDPMLMTYPGMIGVKGGITTKAGHTYVGAATRDGHTVIETLMLGGTDIFDQAARLMDWGFAADGHVTPVGTLGGAQPKTASGSPSPTPTSTPAPASTPTSTPAPASTPTTPATPPAASASSPSPVASSTPITVDPAASTPPPTVTTPSSASPIVLKFAVTLAAGRGGPPASDPAAPHALWWGLLAAAAACAIPLGTLIVNRSKGRTHAGRRR
ncbi:D-alanyl-D-alanine carboxypeptidase family protein [Catenulispora subtropica]|uniref:Peptidase S11 D-alanyl-D-alanine carboxypeptidase A N-terminal domain-containing protein n=1 Tax=Catenulispora subtropica TaxID=450798 RepID=A0ABN2T7S5_9ACTN